MPPPAAERLEKETTRLLLPVSLVVDRALDEVVRHIETGWRPKHAPQSGRAFVYTYLPRARKPQIEKAAAAVEMRALDLARIAVWAALLEMEKGQQVSWPFVFSKKDLAAAVEAAR